MTTFQYGHKYVGAAKRLTPDDIKAVALNLHSDPLNLKALLSVETGGYGFDSYGRPIILYEPHVLWRVVLDPVVRQRLSVAGLAYPAWGTKPYPVGNDAQYGRLDQASAICGAAAAVQACSWGMGQVLAENWKALGFASPLDMVTMAMESEGQQLVMVGRYLTTNHLDTALASWNTLTLAAGYNGRANTAVYSAKLVQAKKAMDTSVRDFPATPATPVGRVTQSSPPAVDLHPARSEDTSADDINAKWLADHPDGLTA